MAKFTSWATTAHHVPRASLDARRLTTSLAMAVALAWVALPSWSQTPASAATEATAASNVAPLAASDPALEAQMQVIASELRCLVCQNQTIADSHAELASDLREQIRKQLRAGATPQAIRAYMVARYGDFILYKPPLKPSTWLLWFGPSLMAVLGVGVLIALLRGRRHLPAEAFDPDLPEPGEGEAEGDEAPHRGPI